MPQSSAGQSITSSAQITDGIILDADVNASAAIAYSKLNVTGLIVNADISAGAAIAYSKLNLALGIVNADISTTAAIAITKLAAGTQGDIFYFAASGVPTRLPAGVANQVLKTGGAGANPSWGAAGGSTFINTYSIGNVANYAVTGLSQYGIFCITLNTITSVNNGVTLRIEIGTGGTPTYSAAYTISASSGAVAQNPLGVVFVTNGDNTNGNGIMPLVNSNGANYATPTAGAGNGAVITAFRFSFSAGNIASGNLTIQGI